MSFNPLQRSDNDTTPPAAEPLALDPYRGDRPFLMAENARLRREIARLKRRRAWPAAAALATYVVILTQLGDWLNGSDPVRYWVAILALVLAFGIGVASAIHLIAGGRG